MNKFVYNWFRFPTNTQTGIEKLSGSTKCERLKHGLEYT